MEENKPLKILLVDDDRFLLDMYLLKFKKSGLDTDTSGTTLEAIQKLRDGKVYDILLMDIIMPGMDGLELLKTIRNEGLVKDAVVIMLTNQGNDVEKAKGLNVDGYIVKAMTIPSEVVDQVLAIYKQRKR